jgi:anaerobic magnesium-protoporphyrin IX monomethyl ester cyclase
MGKRINPEMTKKAVRALTRRGIDVKGYFIFGFPTETHSELEDSIRLIHELWEISDREEGSFRCSAFEFRPYPGTPEWHRIMAMGRYEEEVLLHYESVDLTENGQIGEMFERDEFNFSVNLQFGEVPVSMIHERLTEIMVEQKQRLPIRRDHVQRATLALRS